MFIDRERGARIGDLSVLSYLKRAAPKIAEDSPGLSIVSADFSVYTPIFNFTGLPAIQVTCGFDTDGLPVGLQIAGKPFDEQTICQVGHAYEQATEWHKQHPEL